MDGPGDLSIKTIKATILKSFKAVAPFPLNIIAAGIAVGYDRQMEHTQENEINIVAKLHYRFRDTNSEENCLKKVALELTNIREIEILNHYDECSGKKFGLIDKFIAPCSKNLKSVDDALFGHVAPLYDNSYATGLALRDFQTLISSIIKHPELMPDDSRLALDQQFIDISTRSIEYNKLVILSADSQQPEDSQSLLGNCHADSSSDINDYL